MQMWSASTLLKVEQETGAGDESGGENGAEH